MKRRNSSTPTDNMASAEAALRDCEETLRARAETALSEGRYDDAVHLASFARAVNETATRAENVRLSKASGGHQALSHTQLVDRQLAAYMAGSAVPAWYTRDRDVLVKTVTSKKSGSRYTVRASRQQVEAIVGHLAANGGPDDPIPTRQIFTALSVDGSTPPAHQGHVVLGWLKQIGVIVKRRGDSGYVVPEAGLLDGQFEDLWRSLPPHT
jgi:Tfp pilus assembly protein PilX